MADVEHVDIQDPQIHEPKGVLAASNREVYVANGSLSGAWEKPLSGMETADAGQHFVSDGAGDGSFKHTANIHGEMLVTGYTTVFPVAAATIDPTGLSADGDYVKITGTGMWQAGHLDGVTFNVDELEVTVAGSYEISFWASLEVALASTLIGIKYAINDTAPYSVRKILSKSKNTADINTVFGAALVEGLNVGDTLSIYIAADAATNVVGREAGLVIKLLDEA